MSWVSVFVATLLVVIAINGVVTTPTLRRDLDHVITLEVPRKLANLEDRLSVFNVTENVETKTAATPSTEVEEGRGRKKKYKKHLYRQFWNIMYYYAWFVGIVIIKFKAVLLFLLGNLTFFIISLIRVLIKEVPMWNYLKKSSPTPSPGYGPPQYKYGSPSYGPPATNYGPPSSTYGTPASNYENSYSPVGLYKRQSDPNGNEGLGAHDVAYSGQRE